MALSADRVGGFYTSASLLLRPRSERREVGVSGPLVAVWDDGSGACDRVVLSVPAKASATVR